MPHLRFTRDARGYENTFLVHRDRSRGAGRQAILYWFRTPPDLRVGRGPLDGGAMRTLEAEYPDIQFDWPRILEAPVPDSVTQGGTSRPASPGRQATGPRRDVRDRRRRDRAPRHEGRPLQSPASPEPPSGEKAPALPPAQEPPEA